MEQFPGMWGWGSSTMWVLQGGPSMASIRRPPFPQSPLMPSLPGVPAASICPKSLRNLGLSSWDAPCTWHQGAEGQRLASQVSHWARPWTQGLSLLQVLSGLKIHRQLLTIIGHGEAALLLNHSAVAHSENYQWFCWEELRWEEEAGGSGADQAGSTPLPTVIPASLSQTLGLCKWS